MESIKLNLIPSGANPTCHCSQYDEGRVIRVELFDGLTPYALKSGDAVTLNVRKPDNTIVTTSLTATQGNTYVDIVTTEQICACVGYNLCDLTLTNGSVVIGTLNFIMAIERDVLADGIPSQSVIEDLDALVQEAVGDNYYTKSEVDSALDLKADKSTTYTKTEVDSALALKADASNVYTKSQTDSALALKANSADVYTKSEVDSALALKADKTDVINIYPTDTASGVIATFTDGADNIPIKSLVADIDYNADGVEACNLSTTGINIEGGITLANDILKYLPSATLDTSNKTISYAANSSTQAGFSMFNSLSGQFKEETAYTLICALSKSNTNTAANIRFDYTDGTYANLSLTGTIEANTKYYGVWTTNSNKTLSLIRKANQSGSTTLYYDECGIFEGELTVDQFVPFGIARKIEFGQTIYGGNLNVTTGVLTSTLNADGTEKLTPDIIQLDPVETYSTLGVNNIYADTGNVDVNYRADIGLYIDKKISQIPAPLNS